jgi:hypothetical protein
MKPMIDLDAVNGDDANPGTKDAPVKTMRRAEFRRAQQGVKDILIVAQTEELRAEARALSEERIFAAKVAASKRNGKGVVS